MNEIIKKLLLCLLVIFSFSLISCGEVDNNNDSNTPSDNNGDTDSYKEQVCPICDLGGIEASSTINLEFDVTHNPTTFDVNSVKKTTNEITTGVSQHTVTFNKNNGKLSKVVVTEVDLKHASITGGTADNKYTATKKAVLIDMANAFELENPDKIVVAATNADFFGSIPVNAFVKDGIIIKSGHNDAGIYDPNDISADLPQSMPMLFGISNKVAQIAPMIKNASVKDTVKAKLCEVLTHTSNLKSTEMSYNYLINQGAENRSRIKIVYDTSINATACANSKVLQVKTHGVVNGRIHGEVINIETTSTTTKYRPTDEYFYVMIPNGAYDKDIILGDIISLELSSPDGTWSYYNQIIGCRHALVVDGMIANTVSKESQNGAKGTDIPRTAIGILSNGNVVIISVEALNYNNTFDANNTVGLSLVELADFMRYISCYSAANLDGGGSTQLLTRLSLTSEFKVIVRSSDTKSTELAATRPVINSLLVYVER